MSRAKLRSTWPIAAIRALETDKIESGPFSLYSTGKVGTNKIARIIILPHRRVRGLALGPVFIHTETIQYLLTQHRDALCYGPEDDRLQDRLITPSAIAPTPILDSARARGDYLFNRRANFWHGIPSEDHMNRQIRLVTPDAPPPQPATTPEVTRRKLDAKGIRLGVLDNSKGNADLLLAMIVDGVRAEIAVKSVVSLRKPHVTFPATKEVLDQLAAEADVVISAMAD